MKKLISPPSLLAYAAIIIIIIVVGFAWGNTLTKPADPSNTDTQVFVVKPGQAAGSIGQNLYDQGLIKSPLAFKYVLARHGLSKSIQAGSFRLSPSMSAYEITQEMTHGTLDLWSTILEGWRREEIAASLASDFAEQGINFDEVAFLAATEGKEGYLFPDTYLFPIGSSEENVASILLNTFDKKVTQGLAQEISASPYTMDQIITMASLVEREARTDESRTIVAGILWKRLENDWPLQVDATLQYAKGYDTRDQTWWTPPTYLDKEVVSPYNTYTNPGLPPGPIASPSLSSIQAVLNPTPTEYWFYLTGLDGQMHYAQTIEQHNQNIANYLR